MTGNHDENVAHTFKAIAEIRTGLKVWWKLDAREIAYILAVRHHGLKKVELNHPAKTDITARAREL